MKDFLVDVVMGVEVIIKLTVVIEMEADVEVYEEVDKEVANVVDQVFSCRKSLKIHMVISYWRKAFCM